MLAARPPQLSRHMPEGWVIMPLAGLGDDAIAADGMVLVAEEVGAGRRLIRARRSLIEQGFLFRGQRGITKDPEGA